MKTSNLIAIALVSSLPTFSTLAQTSEINTSDTLPPQQPNLKLSGYLEAYYTQDLNQPNAAERPGFLYNHKRNWEVNINLAYIKAAYSDNRLRANLALQVGTYAQYNYAAEQPLLRPVFEANAGIKLSKSRDLWLDAGVFGSHIGFESAIPKDCWTLTRSIVAENSPYYLAGAKLTYNTPNGKWTLLGSVLNGWQRINRLPGYTKPSLSTQIQYKPTEKLVFNWSSFLGSDRPDSLKQNRFYNNFYTQIFASNKISFILGFDLGMDRKPIGVDGNQVGSGNYVWYTPTLIARYALSSKSFVAGRVEYFADPDGVIISTDKANGFKTWGYSLDYDYHLFGSAVWRIEYRAFNSQDAIFTKTAAALPTRTNQSLTTAFAISF